MIVNNVCVLKEVWLGLALNKLMRRKFGKMIFQPISTCNLYRFKFLLHNILFKFN